MHQFKAEDLVDEVLYKSRTPGVGGKMAPNSVSHEGIERVPNRSNVFWIPHSLILHNGVRCGTGSKEDYMLVVSGRDVAMSSTAERNGLGAVYDAVQTRLRGIPYKGFRFLNTFEQIYIGLELSADRKCGDRVVHAQGSVFLFVLPTATDICLGNVFLSRRAVNMISLVEDDTLCVHTNALHAESRTSPAADAPDPSGRHFAVFLPPPLTPFDLNPPMFLD